MGEMSLEELRAHHRARRESNHRIEDLKVHLMRIAEQHMDHAVRVIRRWLAAKEK